MSTTPAAPTGPEAPERAPDALAHPSGRVDIAERPARAAGPAAAFLTLVLLLALMAGAVILFVSGAVAAEASYAREVARAAREGPHIGPPARRGERR